MNEKENNNSSLKKEQKEKKEQFIKDDLEVDDQKNGSEEKTGEESVEKEKKKEDEELKIELFLVKEELEKLRKKEDLWRIKCADLLNRIENDKKKNIELLQYGNKKILEKIIFFLDSFQKALQVSEEQKEKKETAAKLLEGFQMSWEEFQKILKEQGVEKISVVPLKDVFDPEKHTVIKTSDNPQFPDNVVLSVLQDGYFFHQKILRPAWVEVNCLKEDKKE